MTVALESEAGTLQKREYRFRRYVANVPRHACPLDAFSGDSFDWAFSPIEECAVTRKGSSISFDTGGIGAPVGLLETKIGARCREVVEFRSSLMSYPTVGATYTDETDKEGVFYVRSTVGNVNYQIGKEFGSTHYPTAVGSVPNFKMTPLWCEASQLHTRCISNTQRKFVVPGTRRSIETQNWRLFPSAQGTPSMWNKQYNEASGSGSNLLRLRPWGHYPPMFPMTKSTETASTGTDANLADGDTFYATVFFEDETGALSPAFQTREINGTLTAGLGLYTIGTVGGTAKYRSVQFDDVPLGPDGTVARWIAASAKQTRLATTDAITIDTSLEGFGAIAVIRNNVQNSLVYYGQPPSAFDSLRFRDDIVWPPQAQYAIAAEKRVILCGRMRPNPAAILIAPLDLAGGSPFSQNCSDSASAIGNRFLARVTVTAGAADHLYLKYDDGAATTTLDTAITATMTLQDLCDLVNATTTGGNAKKWCAQLVPGADGSTLASNLAATSGSDFGDDGCVHDATTGNMRCHGPTFPACALYFSQTFMSAFTADDESIWMTSAQPGVAQSAYNDFRLSTRRRPPRNMGKVLGGAAVTGSNTGVIAVIYYERGRCALRNIRGGSSGQDEDYQLVEIAGSRSCVSWSSIVSGNGWAGCMTEDGFEATDGDNTDIFSGDVWNRESGLGVWSYEITQSSAASASGGSDTYFFAMTSGSKLRINYRASSASSTIANRGIEYDFSDSNAARGLRELYRDDGSKFGWSCPFRQSLGAMGVIVNATGFHYYGAVESADSAFTTGTGRIDEFGTGVSDNGTAITCLGYTRTDSLDSLDYKEGMQFDLMHYNPDGLITLTYYRDQARTLSSTLTVPAQTNVVDRSRIPFPMDGSRNRFMWCEFLLGAVVNTGNSIPKAWGGVFRHNGLETQD